MLKIVVFDGGFGGELFADKIENELPIVNVIRVIDWQHSEEISSSRKKARRATEEALLPYIGTVDLIILANHLLSATSLKYFRRKYHNQAFLGVALPNIKDASSRQMVVLTTTEMKKTMSYLGYSMHLPGSAITITMDDLPEKLDQGTINGREIVKYLDHKMIKLNAPPKTFILVCTHFCAIKRNLRNAYGYNIKIYDGFDETIKATCKILKIRGGLGKKK